MLTSSDACTPAELGPLVSGASMPRQASDHALRPGSRFSVFEPSTRTRMSLKLLLEVWVVE